jgi:ketosteroid isomerase-like protein
MSQENVELILRVQPAGDVDLVELHRDDEAWAAWIDKFALHAYPEFECVRPSVPGGKVYRGPDGLRALSLDWLTPWTTYRSVVEEAVDCGDQVLTVQRSYARLADTAQEIEFVPGNVWTVRDGKIARVEYYADRAEALKAAGLAE